MFVGSLGVLKSMTALESGELFSLELGGKKAFCLKLHADESGRMYIAVLNTPGVEELEPFFFKKFPDGYVNSFGKGWVVELIENEDSYVSSEFALREAFGVIIKDQDHVGLRISSSKGSGRPGFLDLPSGSFVPMDHHSVIYTEWKIWANDAHQSTEGAVPLYHRVP
ncbi:hypothetical protein [Hansschlegelia plantiphila]|uniref:Uncharacterized protein n=1 Tax=Hansschlegelia plantiphila TaxID=374655 RepID=A0A9W6J0H9_9HYPH|nr:hypothetical protein [Hansschlegelia plantiphila]GLK67025.1 hypothetical protein GCM10008179_06630 [Hansschlegelia plantiphila]